MSYPPCLECGQPHKPPCCDGYRQGASVYRVMKEIVTLLEARRKRLAEVRTALEAAERDE